MNAQVIVNTYVGQRLPLRMPVVVDGRPAHICGRAFGLERYDVVFEDNHIATGLSRNVIEPNWRELRK